MLQWTKYSGPGAVTFDSGSAPQTVAHFSAPGVYTLMLSARDGVHAVAYDAVVVRVAPRVLISRSGNDIAITFPHCIRPDLRRRAVSRRALLQTGRRLGDNVTGTGGDVFVTDLGAAVQPRALLSRRPTAVDARAYFVFVRTATAAMPSIVHHGVVKFRAAELREMHEFVGHLLDFAADFFAGFHAEIDDLTDLSLEH